MIPIQVSAGAEDKTDVVRLKGVQVHQDGRVFDARVRGLMLSWPKGKWRADFALLDRNGKSVARLAGIFENSGIIISRPNVQPGELRFTFPRVLAPNRARRFRITLTPVPEATPVTAEWHERPWNEDTDRT